MSNICPTSGGSGTLSDWTVTPPKDVICEDCAGTGKGKYKKLPKNLFEDEGYRALIRELAKR